MIVFLHLQGSSEGDITNGHTSNFSSMDNTSCSPPVFDAPSHKPPPHPYKYAGSYDNPLVHPSHHAVKHLHMTSSMDETLLLGNATGGHSNHQHHHHHHHGSGQFINQGYYNVHCNLPPDMSQSYHAGTHAHCGHGNNVHSNSTIGLHGYASDSPVRQQVACSNGNNGYNSPGKKSGVAGGDHHHLSHHSKESGYHSNRPSYHEGQGDSHSNEAYNSYHGNNQQYLYDQYGHAVNPSEYKGDSRSVQLIHPLI